MLMKSLIRASTNDVPCDVFDDPRGHAQSLSQINLSGEKSFQFYRVL